MDPSARATVEYARTDDGWDLALHHYRGERWPPVILCGGYACNRHFLDFEERYSLARFLAGLGFDTWVVELRGRGYSEPAGGSRRRGWIFDDLVRFDVPAALAYVRAHAREQAPVWIGHSMGGMVMYAALGQDPRMGESVAGLVAIASPVAFPPIASALARSIGGVLLALPLPEFLPQQNVLIALWSLASRSPRAAEVGMNPVNIDRRAFGKALRRFMCNVPRGKLQQFIHWSLTGSFRSRDGTIDYRANLHRIVTPALIIAGASDRLASPEVVGLAFDRIGSTRKSYREFATRHADHADYGHVDLIFGRRAPDEVFPAVSDWIDHEIAAR
ncbi:MAG TPA: alpha/beta fold hydrolase [Candidatus Kryptonia bacterium]|nr:alpha/beta fold hydrolase [Candidatus Kryptonia bacterium]